MKTSTRLRSAHVLKCDLTLLIVKEARLSIMVLVSL